MSPVSKPRAEFCSLRCNPNGSLFILYDTSQWGHLNFELVSLVLFVNYNPGPGFLDYTGMWQNDMNWFSDKLVFRLIILAAGKGEAFAPCCSKPVHDNSVPV